MGEEALWRRCVLVLALASTAAGFAPAGSWLRTSSSAASRLPASVMEGGTKVTVRVRKKGEKKAASPDVDAAAAELASATTTTVTVKAPESAPVVQVQQPDLATTNLSTADQLLLEGTTRANCSTILRALQDGANPNVRDPKGRTPLHFTAGLGLAPAAVLLIHYGAQVDVRDGDNLTPMHMAAGYANAQTLRVLVAAGADADVVGDVQGTPLSIVLQLGEYQLGQFLNRTAVQKRLNKKDEKLERLKLCMNIFDDLEGTRNDCDWDELMKEVLTTMAELPDEE